MRGEKEKESSFETDIEAINGCRKKSVNCLEVSFLYLGAENASRYDFDLISLAICFFSQRQIEVPRT